MIGLAKCRLGSGLGFTLRARAFCGPGCLFSKIRLELLLNKQKIQARGLCPKPRPVRARAFSLFMPAPALVTDIDCFSQSMKRFLGKHTRLFVVLKDFTHSAD
jgi:hypothetical protein